MEILTAVRRILLNDSSILGAATGGVHIIDVPADSIRPNIMLMTVSGSDGWTHDGADGLHQDIVRIYSRGDNIQQAITLSTALRAVLNGYVSLVTVYGVSIKLAQHSNTTGDYQDAAKVYRQIDDYKIAYRQS